MQIAQEVRRVLSSKPSLIEHNHFLLNFVRTTAEDTVAKEGVTPEQLEEMSKQRWFSVAGLNPDGSQRH